MPDEEDLVKAVLDGARLRLGEEQVSRLFAEGQSLTADAAVEWALREIKPTDG
jgi:hypothetical protein